MAMYDNVSSLGELLKQAFTAGPGALSPFVEQQPPMQVPAGSQPTVPQQPNGILNNPQADMQMPKEAAQASSPSLMDRIGNAFTINKDNFGNRIGNGLIAAGSLDPASAFAKLDAADESSKIKYNQIAGTPYFWYYKQDGSMAVVDDQGKPIAAGGLAAALQKKAEDEAKLWMRKKDYELQGQAELAGKKEDIRNAPEARQSAQQTQSLIDRYQKAYDIVMPIKKDADGNPVLDEQGQPVREKRSRWDQVAAIPGIKGVAEFFGAKAASDNLDLQEITVDETLLNTARTKGAISNQEMNEFKSPLPKPWADPEVWAQRSQERLRILNKIKAFQESEAARGEAATTRSGGSSGGNVPAGNSPAIDAYKAWRSQRGN